MTSFSSVHLSLFYSIKNLTQIITKRNAFPRNIFTDGKFFLLPEISKLPVSLIVLLYRQNLKHRTPDPDCLENCENLFIECVSSCSDDPACLSQCSRDQADCINGNDLTSMMVQIKYFSACPCKSESILILSTFTYSNVPMIVDFKGKNISYVT